MRHPTFPYPSSASYPYDTRVYLGKKAKRRHFVGEYSADPREKGTYGGTKNGLVQLRTRLEMASDINRVGADCAAPFGLPGAERDPMKLVRVWL